VGIPATAGDFDLAGVAGLSHWDAEQEYAAIEVSGQLSGVQVLPQEELPAEVARGAFVDYELIAAFMQWFASSWTSILAVDTLRRKADARIDAKDWVAAVPVEDYPVSSPPPTADLAPYYRDWVRHERSDEYWKPWRVSDHYAAMNVKALHTARAWIRTPGEKK